MIKNANQVRLVSDLEKAKEYYRDILGFDVDGWGHAIRDNMGFILEQANDTADVRPNKKPSDNVKYPYGWNDPESGRDTYAYTNWDYLDELFKEYKEKGALISKEITIEDEGFQHWKDFSVKDLDGYVITFGSGKSKS